MEETEATYYDSMPSALGAVDPRVLDNATFLAPQLTFVRPGWTSIRTRTQIGLSNSSDSEPQSSRQSRIDTIYDVINPLKLEQKSIHDKDNPNNNSISPIPGRLTPSLSDSSLPNYSSENSPKDNNRPNSPSKYDPAISLQFMKEFRKSSSALPLYSTIERLIQLGADVNTTDKAGWTALHCLCEFHHPNKELEVLKLIQLLLYHRLLPTTLAVSGNSCLHYLCRWKLNENNRFVFIQILSLLTSSGLNLNSQNSQGETPLHHAVIAKSQMVVQILISRGGDPQMKTKNGLNILHLAIMQQDVGLVAQILKISREREVWFDMKEKIKMMGGELMDCWEMAKGNEVILGSLKEFEKNDEMKVEVEKLKRENGILRSLVETLTARVAELEQEKLDGL